MLISIVIPLYNKDVYIRRAISSVVAQTYAQWECIVVDDGSTDQSIDVVSGFDDDRIRVIRQKNQGPSAARNRGAAEANGNWIALLDADDYWLECHLQNLVELIKRYPACGVVGANFWIENAGGKRWLRNRLKPSGHSTVENYFEFHVNKKGPLIHVSSIAIKYSLWNKVGGFRENVRLAEDADLFVRLSVYTDFAFYHEPSAVYFQDTSGFSTRTWRYVGDAPFSDLVEHVPFKKRRHYHYFLARFRMDVCAVGTLISGNKALIRKMAWPSLGSPSVGRAFVFLCLSFFPIKILKLLYFKWLDIKCSYRPVLVDIKKVHTSGS